MEFCTAQQAVHRSPRRCLREAGEGEHPSLMRAMEGGTFVHADDATLSRRAALGTGGYFGSHGVPRLRLDSVERHVLPLLRIGQRRQRRDQRSGGTRQR